MAKLTALEVFNAVARNCGENVVTGLSSLSGLQLVIWDKIIEAIQDICTDENTRWQFLEKNGKIPMVTGSYQYQISALTLGSDLMVEDIKCFRQTDSGINLIYLTNQEWDEKYPNSIIETGYPTEYIKFAGYFKVNRIAGTEQNGKDITFRYWKLPAYYATGTPTGTSDIPEPFDRILLVALATLKVLSYLGDGEMATYKVQVFGNGSDIEGSLDKMKRIYSSPILKPRVTYRF